jgi:hypothetical protein
MAKVTRSLRGAGFATKQSRRLAALAVLLATVALAEEPAAPAQADIAPNFTLQNTQDGLTRIRWPREKAVFLTFGEQASQSQIQAWSKRMRETYTGRIDFVAVAWLDQIPANLLPAAQTVIKTSHPEVLMDTSGSCAERYQCKRGQVNAFVIAPGGEILKRIHEPITEERFAEVQRLLEPHTKDSGAKAGDSKGDPE